MKICLASIHPRRLSGQLESLIALAEHLQQLGHAVVVASAFERGELGGLADEGAASMPAKLQRVWRALREVEHAARGADVVHVNLPTPAFAALGDIVRMRTGLPVVVGFESHLADCVQLVRDGHVLRDPAFYLPRLLINNGLIARCALYSCERYVVSSNLQRQELLALGVSPERIQVLANVSNNGKLAHASRREARERLGLPDASLVSYVGHFHHVKGADMLAAAFGQVRRAHPRARLVLAWSGLGDRHSVERHLAEVGTGDQVIRLGMVDVGDLLAASDVLALPYRLTIGQNAFPNVLLEALSIGVPLVTSRLPLLEELLRHGETALLCRPEDPTSLAEAVSRLLAEPSLGDHMRGRQRLLAAQTLAPAHLAGAYLALYRRVRRGQARILRPAPHRQRV